MVWGYVEPFFASVWEGIPFVFSAVVNAVGGVIVGERGPEMLNLPRGASVTPLPTTGGNTFYITINAADRSTEKIVDDLMPKLRLALDTL